MDSKPFFSVIVPTYNRLKLCQETVASVLNQTFKSFEVLIVDDGSNDGTREAFESNNLDRRIQYFYQKNAGVSSARNLGIKHSQGKYICYLDSDDLWDPNKLAEIHDTILKIQPDILFHDFVKHDLKLAEPYKKTNSDIFPRIYNIFSTTEYGNILKSHQHQSLQLVLSGYPFYPSVITIKRSIHDQYLWDPGVLKSEDFNLILKLSLRYRFDYLDRNLTIIKVHEGNKSRDTITKDKVILNTITAVRNLYSGTDTRNIFNYYLGRNYLNTGLRQFKSGNIRLALPWIIRGILYRLRTIGNI